MPVLAINEPIEGAPARSAVTGGDMITKGIKQLCAEAEREIETMTVAQVMTVKDDPAVQLDDIRDIRELWRDGTIPGATHLPWALTCSAP